MKEKFKKAKIIQCIKQSVFEVKIHQNFRFAIKTAVLHVSLFFKRNF
jgi:hypothetical protein